MIKLTKLEKNLIEEAIKCTDGSNSFLFSTALQIGNKLGWTVNQTKGVYGSLEKKNIISMTDCMLEGSIGQSDERIAYWSMNVQSDDGEKFEPYKDTIEKMEKYLIEREVA